MKYNTFINHSTRFLNPTGVIEEGLSNYSIASENWPYPVGKSIGDVYDNYYAEIWLNGMDWQHTYWFIETYNCESPIAVPFLSFEKHSDEELFNEYDFDILLKFLLMKRKQLVTGQDYKIYAEEIIPYLSRVGNIPSKYDKMYLYHYSHHSQPRVKFYLNEELFGELK